MNHANFKQGKDGKFYAATFNHAHDFLHAYCVKQPSKWASTKLVHAGLPFNPDVALNEENLSWGEICILDDLIYSDPDIPCDSIYKY